MAITAFSPSAFQNNAFQINTGPPQGYAPDHVGGGGLNVYDPSLIEAYRKRIAEAQQERAQDRRKADREDIARLVGKAYNKALGIEEPDDLQPQVTPDVLPHFDEAAMVAAVQEQLRLIGLRATQKRIAAELDARHMAALEAARQRDIAERMQLLAKSEAEDDAAMDEMMQQAERLFNEARKMLQ